MTNTGQIKKPCVGHRSDCGCMTCVDAHYQARQPCSCGKMRVPNGTRSVMDFASVVHRADACVYVGNPEGETP